MVWKANRDGCSSVNQTSWMLCSCEIVSHLTPLDVFFLQGFCVHPDNVRMNENEMGDVVRSIITSFLLSDTETVAVRFQKDFLCLMVWKLMNCKTTGNCKQGATTGTSGCSWTEKLPCLFPSCKDQIFLWLHISLFVGVFTDKTKKTKAQKPGWLTNTFLTVWD